MQKNKVGIRIIGSNIIFEVQNLAEAKKRVLEFYGPCEIEYWSLKGLFGGTLKVK